MFEHLEKLSDDSLLGLMELYRNDDNPLKIDLGVGVYKDETLHTPVLSSVKLAEEKLLRTEDSKVYLPPVGVTGFLEGMSELVFGERHEARRHGRLTSVQTPGGTGALRLAAEVLSKSRDNARIWLSDPSWANHEPLMRSAGLDCSYFPYYDYENQSIQFDAMLETLNGAATGDIVLLHGCCHNPSGADLTEEQWDAVIDLIAEKRLLPFIDIAYQGFGVGMDEDAYGVRKMASRVPEAVFASSCSKNFGLYRERTGTVFFLTETEEQSEAVRSQVLAIARTMHSMPPAHGALLVDLILNDQQLRNLWLREVDEMRERINGLRKLFARRMADAKVGRDFSFIEKENGMFSFLGISPQQVDLLQKEYSIYMADTSRINVAGINRENIDYLVSSLKTVLAQD